MTLGAQVKVAHQIPQVSLTIAPQLQEDLSRKQKVSLSLFLIMAALHCGTSFFHKRMDGLAMSSWLPFKEDATRLEYAIKRITEERGDLTVRNLRFSRKEIMQQDPADQSYSFNGSLVVSLADEAQANRGTPEEGAATGNEDVVRLRLFDCTEISRHKGRTRAKKLLNGTWVRAPLQRIRESHESQSQVDPDIGPTLESLESEGYYAAPSVASDGAFAVMHRAHVASGPQNKAPASRLPTAPAATKFSTPLTTVQLGLESLMHHIGTPQSLARTPVCCTWHAAILSLQEALNDLHRGPNRRCFPAWKPYSAWQCKMCGAFMDSSPEEHMALPGVCEICGCEDQGARDEGDGSCTDSDGDSGAESSAGSSTDGQQQLQLLDHRANKLSL